MKKLLALTLAVLTGSGILFFACTSDSSSVDTVKEEPTTVKVPIPAFNRDSAYNYVVKQLEFGPRVVGSPESKACQAWLVEQFKAFGATVIEQDFKAKVYTGETFDATNIIAQFNPAASKRIVLSAHWDSRHIADSPLSTERQNEAILGADDGASGVAVLLEIARALGANPISMGVDIVLFDAEDYGDSNDRNSWALGAQHWSRNLHANPYRPKYGILLDMVGSKGARFTKEQWSMQYARPVVEKVWKLAQRMGYGNYFVDVMGNPVTDDHYFVNTIAQIPMIDIINNPVSSETGFGAYWHTHNDNIDIIDPRTLRAVGQVVLATIYREANGTF